MKTNTKNRPWAVCTLGVILTLLVGFASSAFASIGSSTGYTLQIADTVDSGASMSSTSYDSTGITGDGTDGKGSSSSYQLCSGFIEEIFGTCTTLPTTAEPPDAGDGGGASGGSGGRPPTADDDEIDDEEPPEEPGVEPPSPTEPPPSIPEQPIIPPQDLQPPTDEPSQVTPSAPPPPAPTEDALPDLEIPEPRPISPFFDDISVKNQACVGHPTTLFPAAPEPVQKVPFPWWPLAILFMMIASLLSVYADYKYPPITRRKKKDKQTQ